jgi:hypothetical protein
MSLGLPGGAKKVEQDYPEVWSAYAKLGEACAQSGPLRSPLVRAPKAPFILIRGVRSRRQLTARP